MATFLSGWTQFHLIGGLEKGRSIHLSLSAHLFYWSAPPGTPPFPQNQANLRCEKMGEFGTRQLPMRVGHRQ